MLAEMEQFGVNDYAEITSQLLQEKVMEWGEYVYEQVIVTFKCLVSDVFETFRAYFLPSENAEPPEDGESENRIQFMEFQSLEKIS